MRKLDHRLGLGGLGFDGLRFNGLGCNRFCFGGLGDGIAGLRIKIGLLRLVFHNVRDRIGLGGRILGRLGFSARRFVRLGRLFLGLLGQILERLRKQRLYVQRALLLRLHERHGALVGLVDQRADRIMRRLVKQLFCRDLALADKIGGGGDAGKGGSKRDLQVPAFDRIDQHRVLGGIVNIVALDVLGHGDLVGVKRIVEDAAHGVDQAAAGRHEAEHPGGVAHKGQGAIFQGELPDGVVGKEEQLLTVDQIDLAGIAAEALEQDLACAGVVIVDAKVEGAVFDPGKVELAVFIIEAGGGLGQNGRAAPVEIIDEAGLLAHVEQAAVGLDLAAAA